MAIDKNLKSKKVKVLLDKGLDENNKEITGAKTISNIRQSISDDVLFNFSKKFSSLQKHPLKNIIKTEEYELFDDGQ